MRILDLSQLDLSQYLSQFDDPEFELMSSHKSLLKILFQLEFGYLYDILIYDILIYTFTIYLFIRYTYLRYTYLYDILIYDIIYDIR